MAGDIFYSSLDPNLRIELDARAKAGFSSRNTKDLDFMLSKITNVEITAYKGPILKNTEKVDYKENISRFATLGGRKVRTGSYLPNTGNPSETQSGGYLTADRPARRIPPVITLAEINIGDHSMALLNKATFNVLISDPSADLNEFESVWFRPGRNVEVRFEGHKNQIVSVADTTGLLEPPPSTLDSRRQILIDKYGADSASEKQLQFRKMNEITFAGVITSFTFSYQPDGTVEATIMMSGTSNIFTDVSLMLPKQEGEKSDNNETNTFYKKIEDTVNASIAEIENQIIINEEIIINNISDQSILVGSLYKEKDYSTQAGREAALRGDLQNQYKYISLGYLIDLINKNLIVKLNNVPTNDEKKEGEAIAKNAKIICTDDVCQGAVYEYLVSADPKEIILWRGTNANSSVSTYPDTKTEIKPSKDDNTVGTTTDNKTVTSQEIEAQKIMPDVTPKSAGFQVDGKTFPSRIYIGVESVLKLILEKDDVETVNDLLKHVSGYISRNTGGIIKMRLITDPQKPDVLLYYNANYIGDANSQNSVNQDPFLVPMSARNSLDTRNSKLPGSIVTDAKISSKLPDNLKNLAFVLNEGSEISKSSISPFVTYMYADEAQKENIAAQYLKKHNEIIEQLREAKALLTNDYTSVPNVRRLRELLYKYQQYPTKKIQDTNILNAPTFIFDAEITIEGIQGFKIGDVMQLPVLPDRYRKEVVFSVIGITHNVDASGIWQTKLKLIMRPKVK